MGKGRLAKVTIAYGFVLTLIIMGSSGSKLIVLECMLKNFDKFKSNYGIKMKQGKLWTL